MPLKMIGKDSVLCSPERQPFAAVFVYSVPRFCCFQRLFDYLSFLFVQRKIGEGV